MENYNKALKKWIDDEKAAVEFINVASKLWFDKSIELILLRSTLIDCGAAQILNKHIEAEAILKNPVKVQDSLLLAQAILTENVAPTRLDIGRLNAEWSEEKKNFVNINEFIKTKLKEFIGAAPRSKQVQDVVLYGFGRIGRLLAHELVKVTGNGSQLRLRAIVTRTNNPDDLSKRLSLFRKDSVHGSFSGVAIEDVDNKCFHINGNIVHFIVASDPSEIDYTAYGIHDALIIDNTGVWRDRAGLSRHLQSKGAARVLLTAPGKGDIPNVVYGANQDTLNLDSETIFSAASCTTNAIVPGLTVIEQELGIVKGHIETIHAYTNDQNLLDNYHKKSRRGRSAPLNMVLTETGAGSAAAKVNPAFAGILTSNAVRVPTPNVSLAILTLEVKKETSVEEVNNLFLEASLRGKLIEQIRYSNSTEYVSSDGIGDPHACIFDQPSTKVSADKKTVIIYLWYDNEFGYTAQCVRLAKHIGKVKKYRYY